MANIPTREFLGMLIAVEQGNTDSLNLLARKTPLVEAALLIAGRFAKSLAEIWGVSTEELLSSYALQLAVKEPEGVLRG